MNLKEDLNQTQYEAVTTTEGPVLVIAGAGSGKTRVIEYRVLHLIQNKVDPQAILLLTFTRRAAREMLSRASRHDTQCQHVDGGTFHSFAYRMLRKYSQSIGLSPSFSILDEGDSEEAIQRAASKFGVYEEKPGEKKRFPKKDTLKSIFSATVNKGFSVNDILYREYPHFVQYAPEIEKIRSGYDEYKKAKGYLDYDDLLLYLKALLADEATRDNISQKYCYIMVDEYQDTNRLQGEIVFALGSRHSNVMAVGDDAQSIYGFRGATHENIMRFPKEFPGCKIITLEKNYRSLQGILDVANPILENMEKKYPKRLVSAQECSGGRPIMNYFANAYDEAEWIAGTIRNLLTKGFSADEIAVLYRASHLSIPLQAELAKNGVDFRVFGGLRFYELAHTKDVMAYLKIITNHRDELAWHRVLTMVDGIGPATADKIIGEIIACTDMGAAVTRVLAKYGAGYKYSVELKKLITFLKAISDKKCGIVEQLSQVVGQYTPIMEEKFDDWPQRATDLEALERLITHYHSLKDFLADLAIEPPEKRGIDFKTEDKAVTLSTIHSAKGLEWGTVFIIALADGCLPSQFAIKDSTELEEEQRLLYVAVTRAKNNLWLSLPMETERADLPRVNKLCRFLAVPNVLEKISEQGVYY
ncbi:MAG: ATP-dependent helicase [Planctomycetes bacterium]|nr:ATP-dependent helicase [Planctomycetota bacterium]